MRKFTAEDRSNTICLYLPGETRDEIARKTGFSEDTVSGAEKDFQAQVRAQSQKRRARRMR